MGPSLPSGMKGKETGGSRNGPSAQSLGPWLLLYFWFPFLPCCAQRLGSQRSHRAGWQRPGLTLAHGSPAVATGRVLLFSQARAQICCLAAFPAQGLPLGQVGPGDSSRENSSHKFMGCDKSHKQGNSRALGLGPGDSFQPASLGEEDGQSQSG